jgi:hypothetical protein
MARRLEKRPIIYSFYVTVGRQKAVVQKDNILFVLIEKPVVANAVMALEKESALFVINSFPCKADGAVVQNQPAAIIFKNKAKEVKLSDTLDKRIIKPGTYPMNVVAHKATSRLVFTVSEMKGDVKLPDFKKTGEFLKGKK